MDRLSALDRSFLDLERDIQQLHVGSALIFEGPAPSYAELCTAIESKLAAVPRYRQYVRHVPLELGRPVWADDPHFNIGYHIRHSALPAPGNEQQLRTLAARLMSQRLDLSRPLWEMYLVEGLDDGRWALINKAHHAMIDGVSGQDIMGVVLDREAHATPASVQPWEPSSGAAAVDLVAGALIDQLRHPVDAARGLVGALLAPGRLASQAAIRLGGIAHYGGRVVRPESILNGPIGPHRRWAWARADLADVKKVKDTFGGTVNDVILAAVAGAFRVFLQERGELGAGSIRTMVPVSMRLPHQRGTLGNQISAIFADLPIGTADPVERLHAITAQLGDLKRRGTALGARSMLTAADFVPPTLLALGARAAARLPQRMFSTVTTNIPGPQRPLYLLGRELTEMFPYIPLAVDLRITVGIFSYQGRLNIGVTGDYDQVRDLDVLSTAIESSVAELVAATTASRS